MTPTQTIAPPPKKIDIYTMIQFRGELAASTEVSPAPVAQQGPLSPPPHQPASSTTLHCPDFRPASFSPAVTFSRFSLLTPLPALGLAVSVQILEASDLGFLSSLPTGLHFSKITIKMVPGMILLKLCSDHIIHSFD